eukprot:TRINITY_DN5956_c0_g1_i3.p1 TRINITY_DN5956_c0_g1~~TRINITY_DN5956_c0_g1_i3.p1  ORF type:complete len:244 (-),score=1.98 TRINITY_DN5956_c0_g1_i3:151-882(-)
MNGYWGPRTSSVDWCEHNYIHTGLVAETWNTLSSLVLCLLGVVGIYHSIHQVYDGNILLTYIMLFCVGVGSTAFHATLLHVGQAMDELTMIFLTLLFIYSIFVVEKPLWDIKLRVGLFLYASCVTAIYFLIPEIYSFFLLTYGSLVIFTLLKASYVMSLQATSLQLFKSGCFCFAAGFFLCWIPENLLCPHVRFLQLHSWWHVLAALATYQWATLLTYHTYEKKSENVEYKKLFGGLYYVVFS